MEIASIGLKAALDRVANSGSATTPIVVLAGAAVSMAVPSTLPVVGSFCRALADELADLDPTIGDRGAMARGLASVPFELLLEQIEGTLVDRPQFVPDLLTAVYSHGVPNRNHMLIAEQLCSGRLLLVLTTNFDRHIEQANSAIRSLWTEDQIYALVAELGQTPGEPIAAPLIPTVVHLHGVVGDEMDATMRRVSRPLTGARADLLRRIGEGATLAAVGYSGSDVDIGPFLDHARSAVWYLNRSASARRGRFLRVELNPAGAGYGRFGDREHTLLVQLERESQLQRLLGVAEAARHRPLAAARRFQRARRHDDSPAARLGLARALTSLYLFRAAAHVLEPEPGQSDPLWARLVDERAFLKRHVGDYPGAIQDFGRLRQTLTARLERTRTLQPGTPPLPDLVWELERASCHEVEARLLLASDPQIPDRLELLKECPGILESCREWLEHAPTVPAWDAEFFRGELALSTRRWDAAVRGYRAYKHGAARWERGNERAIADVRVASAYAASNRPLRAVRSWARGLMAALAMRSPVHLAQYLVAVPVLLGRPGYLWWARRTAVHGYGLIEALITWLLVATGRIRYEHRAAVGQPRGRSPSE